MKRTAKTTLARLVALWTLAVTMWAVQAQSQPQRIAFSESHPQLYLDLFRPAGESPSGDLKPAVLCLHGGGWMKGDPGKIHATAAEFASRGFVAVASSYRLTDEATFPAQLEDVIEALAWMKSDAGATEGIDPDRIFVMGSSAGGHLAVLVGVHDDVPDELRPTATFGIGAQSDFTAPHIVSAAYTDRARFYVPLIGGSYQKNPQGYLAASPLHHLDASDKPVGFLTGALDQPTTHATRFRREAFRLGVPTTFSTIKDAPHALLNQEGFRKEAVDRMVAFFERNSTGAGRVAIEWDGAEGILKPMDPHWQRLGGDYNGCEGAQWLEGAGDSPPSLVFAAHHDHLAFTWREDTGLRLLAEDTAEASTWRPAGNGELIVLEQQTRQLAFFNRSGNRQKTVLSDWDGKRFNRPNDLAIRPGKKTREMWMTDPQYSFRNRPLESPEYEGQYVFRITRSGEDFTVEPAIQDLRTPNGIVFDRTGRELYVGDSGAKKVFKYNLSEEGKIVGTKLFAEGFKALDGLAVDQKGHIWAGTRDAAFAFNEQGEKIGEMKFPGMVTSIAFSRPNADGVAWVAITTREAAHVARFRF